MLIATIHNFKGEEFPVDSKGRVIQNKPYNVLKLIEDLIEDQEDQEHQEHKNNGVFNLLLQCRETGEEFISQSIDFDFSE